MTLVKVTVLIEEIPVIMTVSNTIVSTAVKRLKPNASHIERDILSSFCCESVDDAPLTPSNNVPEALLRFVLDDFVSGQDSQYGVQCVVGVFGTCEEDRSVANGSAQLFLARGQCRRPTLEDLCVGVVLATFVVARRSFCAYVTRGCVDTSGS
jgi:hypothetical protein